MSQLVLGLGSNLGHRKKYLENAISQLQEKLLLKDVKKSKIIENKALLLPNSPASWDIDFLNIVIAAEIDLEQFLPEDILKIIKQIEQDLGRKQSPRWAPREIDIDILAIDNLQIKITDKLTIPHKDLFNREFFIDGFAEVAGDLLEELKSLI